MQENRLCAIVSSAHFGIETGCVPSCLQHILKQAVSHRVFSTHCTSESILIYIYNTHGGYILGSKTCFAPSIRGCWDAKHTRNDTVCDSIAGYAQGAKGRTCLGVGLGLGLGLGWVRVRVRVRGRVRVRVRVRLRSCTRRERMHVPTPIWRVMRSPACPYLKVVCTRNVVQPIYTGFETCLSPSTVRW